MHKVPVKKWPFGNVRVAAKMVKKAPSVVTKFALTPTLIKPRQIGVINLVTGARNDS